MEHRGAQTANIKPVKYRCRTYSNTLVLNTSLLLLMSEGTQYALIFNLLISLSSSAFFATAIVANAEEESWCITPRSLFLNLSTQTYQRLGLVGEKLKGGSRSTIDIHYGNGLPSFMTHLTVVASCAYRFARQDLETVRQSKRSSRKMGSPSCRAWTSYMEFCWSRYGGLASELS